MIYAFFGLARDAVAIIGVGYSKSVREVYVAVSKYLIHEGYRLAMLSMGAQQHQRRHHLLSWVPDFSAAPIPMALSAKGPFRSDIAI